MLSETFATLSIGYSMRFVGLCYILGPIANFGGCGDPLVKEVQGVEPQLSPETSIGRKARPRISRKPEKNGPNVRVRKSENAPVVNAGLAPFRGPVVQRMDYSDVIEDIRNRVKMLELANGRGPLAPAHSFYTKYLELVEQLQDVENRPHIDIDPQCPPTNLKVEINGRGYAINRGRYIAHGSSSRIFKSAPVAELGNRTLIVKSLGPLPDKKNVLEKEKTLSRKLKLALLEDEAFMVAFASFHRLAPHSYTLSAEGMNEYCHAITIVSENVGARELGDIPANQRHDANVLNHIGASALQIIERIHQTGLIHGDIHRRNFIVKDSNKPAKTLRIIDFGRVDLFMLPHRTNYASTGETVLIPDNPHPQMKSNGWREGLLSPWEIEGHRPTRRDDLFRIAEMLIFMYGDPTFHEQYNAADAKYEKSDKTEKAMNEFLTTVISLKRNRRFDSNFPQKVIDFYEYTLTLKYEDKPKYQEWIKRFRNH